MGQSSMKYFDIDYVAMDKRRAGKAEVGVQRYIVDPDTFERREMTPQELEQGIEVSCLKECYSVVDTKD